MKDDAGAMEDFNKAILLAPDYQDAYHNRGLLRLLLNDKDGACFDWRRAAELGKTDSREAVAKYCR
jgi:Flp pilus assembly protein TadD